MATWANLPYYLTLKTKKTSLFYMAVTTVLCSLSYLIGIWQHGGLKIAAKSPMATLLELPCSNLNKNFTTIGGSSSVTLDFTARHNADDLVPLSSSARAEQIPPCKPEFSEYTPCEDVNRSLKFDRDRNIYRERHCPDKDELLKCRIPAPHGYKTPFRWPASRDMVWYANVPHKHLTVEKAKQNWVQFKGDRFKFPGGGTMFPRGADSYIADIGKFINLKDGSIRTAIDTGCGVSKTTNYIYNNSIKYLKSLVLFS